MNETYERIAAELGASFENRKSLDALRDKERRSWEADYGSGKKAKDAAVFLPRLADVGSGDTGYRSSTPEAHFSFRRYFDAFRSEVTQWCIGTRVFIICVGLAAFIIVV